MADEQVLYTAHNIWYEKADRVFAINYKKGIVIPAGSRVTGVRAVRGGTPQLHFVVPDAAIQVTMHLQPKYAPNVSIEAFRDRTLTPASWEKIIEGLEAQEIESVRSATVQIGISRRAVLAAYGYPPEHFTPSLEKPVWTYWINRFIKKELFFDANGKTTTTLP